MCIQKEKTKKKRTGKGAREDQREWWSRRRHLPSSDKKMTSSHTKKETAKQKRNKHHHQQNIRTTRWNTFVISRIFLPLFIIILSVESRSETFNLKIKKSWNDKRPTLFIGKVNEPKITHTQLSLSSDLKWVVARLFLYYLNRHGPDEVSVVDVNKYLTVVEDR